MGYCRAWPEEGTRGRGRVVARPFFLFDAEQQGRRVKPAGGSPPWPSRARRAAWPGTVLGCQAALTSSARDLDERGLVGWLEVEVEVGMGWGCVGVRTMRRADGRAGVKGAGAHLVSQRTPWRQVSGAVDGICAIVSANKHKHGETPTWSDHPRQCGSAHTARHIHLCICWWRHSAWHCGPRGAKARTLSSAGAERWLCCLNMSSLQIRTCQDMHMRADVLGLRASAAVCSAELHRCNN